MAQLVGTVAGSAAGSFGGPVGSMAGALIDQAIFGSSAVEQEAPRVNDLLVPRTTPAAG
jgi:hypothetical protein